MSSEDAGELLRRHQLRVTPQRRAMLEAFRGRRDEHLSAEEVMSRASRVVPDIGRGTVYAALAELAEVGLLASVGDSEPIRYECNLEPHDHLRCRQCLRLFDVDLGGAQLRLRRLDGYTVETLTVHAEGVCADCHDYQRGLSDGARSVLGERTVSDGTLAALTCSTISSPVGEMAVAASTEGIVRLAFDDHADFSPIAGRARSRRGPTAARDRLRVLDGSLRSYFAGSPARLTDVVDWRHTTEAGRRLFPAAQEIPYSEHGSYERLSGDVSAYEIGRVMGSNPWPVIIPCHRVSCGSLRPTEWVGGGSRLSRLHELEAG
jgi:Fe2+ or Zn2+ uptake regulation protein/O6-methylguanine-DNA--protein-cysteine methyltransferase